MIKDFQTTISGILYRGGSRGANPLSEAQLQHLCEEGVGHAIYTYDTGFKKAPARTCTMKDGRPGKIEYSYFRFLDKKGIEDSMAATKETCRSMGAFFLALKTFTQFRV